MMGGATSGKVHANDAWVNRECEKLSMVRRQLFVRRYQTARQSQDFLRWI